MKVKSLSCLAAILLSAGCTSHNNKTISVPTTFNQDPTAISVRDSAPLTMVLKASAFRMSGDYADHVAVTLGADGKLSYYPAPIDITDLSAPVEIGDGWWLNRQGISPNSVFTKWTFAEYRALKTTPSPAEIKKAIIPGASVTEFRKLPVAASEADRMDPKELLKYLP